MTATKGKSAMVAVYCEEVKQREWRLRRLKQDVAKAGHTTKAQSRVIACLKAEARTLYVLRRVSRRLTRERIQARNAALMGASAAS